MDIKNAYNIKNLFINISKAELSREFAKRDINISPQAIGQWQKVPPKHALAVESITGVSRYELLPEVYGKSPDIAS